jgi:hypothetical protein
MTPFRDSTTATDGYGRMVVEALKRSASRSTAFRSGRKQVFLFDTPDALETFKKGFGEVLRERRIFTPQYYELRAALGQAHSMLLVIHGDTLHIMCHEDPEHFEEVLCCPRRVKRVLKEFRGVSSRYTYGNLRAVPSA